MSWTEHIRTQRAVPVLSSSRTPKRSKVNAPEPSVVVPDSIRKPELRDLGETYGRLAGALEVALGAQYGALANLLCKLT